MYITDTHGFCQSKSYTADHIASYSAFAVTAVLVTSTVLYLSPSSLILLYFVHWALPCPCCDQFQFQDFVGYVYLHTWCSSVHSGTLNKPPTVILLYPTQPYDVLYATVFRVHAY